MHENNAFLFYLLKILIFIRFMMLEYESSVFLLRFFTNSSEEVGQVDRLLA